MFLKFFYRYITFLYQWLWSPIVGYLRLFPEFDNTINAFKTSFDKHLLNTTMFCLALYWVHWIIQFFSMYLSITGFRYELLLMCKIITISLKNLCE